MPLSKETIHTLKLTGTILTGLGAILAGLNQWQQQPEVSVTTASGTGSIAVGRDYVIQSGMPTLHPDRRFLGMWNMQITYAGIGGETMQFDGITEYFNNGGYNLKGQVRFFGTREAKAVEAIYAVLAAGEWQFEDNYLTFRQNDIKSTAQSASVNGKPFDIALGERVTGKPFPNFSDAFVKGMSGGYKGMTLNENQMNFTARAEDGQPIRIELRRHM